MSFCTNPRGECQPGPITGSPLHGLCEKTCIEVKKVYDAGLMQQQVTDISTPLVNPFPPNPVQPLTFVSASTSSSRGVVSNVLVERLSGTDRQARVRCTVGIPMTVVYTDANGAEGMAETTLPIAMDVVMCIPEPSIIPYEVEAVVSAIASEGSIALTTVTMSCCVTVILKLVIEAELLIPSYGYCRIPPMQEFASDVCAGFFELPLYP